MQIWSKVLKGSAFQAALMNSIHKLECVKHWKAHAAARMSWSYLWILAVIFLLLQSVILHFFLLCVRVLFGSDLDLCAFFPSWFVASIATISHSPYLYFRSNTWAIQSNHWFHSSTIVRQTNSTSMKTRTVRRKLDRLKVTEENKIK